MEFTSISTNHKEKLTVTVDFIGGTYHNTITTLLPFTKVNWVKQAGKLQSFTITPENTIGVGAKRGMFLVNYDTEHEQGRLESRQAEIKNDGGVPNNYVTTSKFPVLSINTPEFANSIISGVSHQNVLTYTVSGNIELDYQYDSGEAGVIKAKAYNDELEIVAKQSSLATLEQTLETKKTEAAVNYKMSGLYQVASDMNDIKNEIQGYVDEHAFVGTWEPTTVVVEDHFSHTSYQTFRYTGGQGTAFSESVQRANVLNYDQLNVLTQKLLVTSTVAQTTTYSISANNDAVFFDPEYKSSVNPTEFIIKLTEPKYITKLRLKGYHDNKLQEITSVKIGDTEILKTEFGASKPTPLETSQYPIQIDCLQKFTDSNGIALTDENKHEYWYFIKTDTIRFTVHNPMEPFVFLEHVEFETLNPKETDLKMLDGYWDIRTENEEALARPFGPDNGNDGNPPTGRATWWNVGANRLLKVSTRTSELSGFYDENIPDTQNLIDDPTLSGQKVIWRDKSDSSYSQSQGIANSINSTSVDITKSLLTLEALAKQL
jgi:hypothetical protein